MLMSAYLLRCNIRVFETPEAEITVSILARGTPYLLRRLSLLKISIANYCKTFLWIIITIIKTAEAVFAAKSGIQAPKGLRMWYNKRNYNGFHRKPLAT